MSLGDLPIAAAQEHVKAFERAGWEVLKRRGRGSHWLLRKPGERLILSIPDHREVKRALLSKQIANAGLTHDEYLEFFND